MIKKYVPFTFPTIFERPQPDFSYTLITILLTTLLLLFLFVLSLLLFIFIFIADLLRTPISLQHLPYRLHRLLEAKVPYKQSRAWGLFLDAEDFLSCFG